MKPFRIAQIAIAFFCLVGGISQLKPARANTVTVDITLKHYMVDAQGQAFTGGYFPIPFQLAVGDTLDLRFLLPPGQSMVVTDPKYMKIDLITNGIPIPSDAYSVALSTTSTLYYLDASGPANAPTLTDTSGGLGGCGPNVAGYYCAIPYIQGDFRNDLTTGQGTISFSGFEPVTHIDALTEWTPSGQINVDNLMPTLTFSWWSMDNDGVTTPPPLPEISTWVLLTMGVTVVGATLRSDRKRLVTWR